MFCKNVERIRMLCQQTAFSLGLGAHHGVSIAPLMLQIRAAQHDGPTAANGPENTGFRWTLKMPAKLLVIGAASACCLSAVAFRAGRR